MGGLCFDGEWKVVVRRDGGAVRVYRWGKLQEEFKPGEDTYDAPAGAMEFAEELAKELKARLAVGAAPPPADAEESARRRRDDMLRRVFS